MSEAGDYPGDPARSDQLIAELRGQLERATRLAAVGEQAVAVAHEINNPLTVVFEYLTELQRLGREAELPAPVRELLAGCADSLESLDQIRRTVADLAHFSKDDGPGDESDAHRSIDGAIALLWNQIYHRAGLVRSYGHLPPVRCGETRLQQVLVNVLANAIQAIPAGDAGHHRIEVRTRRASAGAVVIEVEDSGRGIDTAHIRDVFEPYFTTGGEGRTGLGLTISRGLLSEVGGSIALESSSGSGTRVTITVPTAGPAQRSTAADDGAHERGTRIQGLRILGVDDDTMIAKALVRRLKDHDVVSLNSGREAAELLDSDTDFDVVLCDLMMPDVGGRELYRRVAARNPLLAPRFVFMTGGAFESDAVQFLDSVPNPLLDKPFTTTGVQQALQRIIAAHGRRRG